MAIWQEAQRAGERHIAEQASAVNARNPQTFSVQRLSAEAMVAVLKMLGGRLEDSSIMLIVSPGGPFYKQPGISDPAGTDVDRP